MKTVSYKVSDTLFLVSQPAAKAAVAKPAEVSVNHIVAIDCSGSMYGELPRIREQIKLKLPKLLGANDTVSIVWFSGRTQFGVLLEAERVATLTDLSAVNKAVDQWLRPQGMTGFKEPLEEVERLAGRLAKKAPGAATSLFFMSDGCDNQWPRAEIMKAVEKAAGAVSSVTVVEYGYYADRPTLAAMAEKAGGSLIFADAFDKYAPAFEAAMQRKVTGAPRVEVKVSGDPVRGLAWAVDGSELVTYAVESGSVKVPETTRAVWYLSPAPIGKVGTGLDLIAKDAADPNMDSSDLPVMDQAYAALSLFSVRMAPEVVLPLLKATGDVSFIEKFGGLFGKQKYSEFMDEAKAAALDPSKRLTKGFNPKLVPAEDAFTVLDMLRLLASDDANRVLLEHPAFKYSRIGRGRVDANTVLTDEEQEELEKLTAELSGLKDVKRIKEINARIAEVTDKPEPLQFAAAPAPDGYPVSSLTYTAERPNVSVLIRKAGTVDVSKARGRPASVPDTVDTFIIRNYSIVKDGLVNVKTLPVRLSAKTLEVLFAEARAGRLPDDVITSDGDVTLLNFGALPVINRMMVKAASAKAMFENEWELLKVQARQKVYNSLVKKLFGGKKSEGFVERYGADGAAWLKEAGFSEGSGFGPKSRQAESTDVYMAKELSVSVKGYSTIPSLADFEKQLAKGKLNPPGQLMEPAWKDFQSFIASDEYAKAPSSADQEKALEAWVVGRQKPLDAVRRSMIAAKAQQVFSVVVGQTWFSEFSSQDEHTMDLTLDGLKVPFSVDPAEKEVKI